MDEVNVAVMAPILGRDLSFVSDVDPRVRVFDADEDALVDAVTAGRIRGAVLDVYAGELAGRPPRAELAGLPQILLTPHISGSGDTKMAEPIRRLFAENLRRYLAGQPLLNVVDRARGY